MRTRIATLLALIVVALMAAPTPASAHTITRTSCAQAAHREMVNNPPHTAAQRRESFRRCLSFAAQHNLGHKLTACTKTTLGNHHTRWTVVRACQIMAVWPTNGSDQAAVTVAWCEGTFNPDASNGQYKGTFQMGTGERARWGHGSSIAAQTTAAHGYYDYSVKHHPSGGFGPWSCKPGSVDNRDAWSRAPRVLVNYVY